MGPHPRHLHRAIPRAGKDRSHQASLVGTFQTLISMMVQYPHSIRLSCRESRSFHGKLHNTQTQGPRSDQ